MNRRQCLDTGEWSELKSVTDDKLEKCDDHNPFYWHSIAEAYTFILLAEMQ
jgi:hypothetical protein